MKLLNHWLHIRLRDACTKIGSGSTPRGGDSVYQEFGPAIIRSQNVYNGFFAFDGIARLSDHHAEKLAGVIVQANDVLLNITGDSVARCCQVPVNALPARVNQHVAIIRPDPGKLNPKFLCYYLISPLMQSYLLSIAGSGGTRKALTKGMLEDFQVPCPPRIVQDKITDILSGYDDLIENNRRRMELLEASARHLYEEWFVRLRFPGHEHTGVIDDLPRGWERHSVAELVESDELDLQTGPFGTQLKASDYTETGAPVINVRNIGHGNIRPEKLEFVPENIAERLHKHVLANGDIVFGRKGAVDRHVLIRAAQHGWVQGSDCIRMRSNSQRISTTLMSLAFRDESHKEWMLTQCSNKATMASLNQEVLGRIDVVIPSDNIRQVFLEMASTIFAQIDNLDAQNERLKSARDHLLPRLMSGEVPV